MPCDIAKNAGKKNENRHGCGTPDDTRGSEESRDMSMAGSLDHIHPSLMPAVHHSYELAQDILRLSDLLYQLEHRSGGDS